MRALLLLIAVPAALSPQAASLTYRLGKDTLAIEQYTRTANGITGEMVQRTGAAVVRYAYTMTLGKDGRPTAATLKRMMPDGSPAPGGLNEVRYLMGADSVIRETIFSDSVQRRAFAAKGALISWPTYVYGPTEVLASMRNLATVDSVLAVNAAGNLSYIGLTPLGGDSVRLRGPGYPMVLRFDASNRLLSLDGSGTTNKAMATRGAGGMDLAAIAQSMKPTGTLSPREDARAVFGPGGIVLVDYSRPQARGRTVWGGTLVPYDSIWRMGANEATHLFTTRTLTFGNVTLNPGIYTLWMRHTRSSTWLIINRQTGQWGTVYNATQDIARVEMQSAPALAFVETLTIAVRGLSPTRGALELAWGDRVASAPFTVSEPR